MTSILTFLKNNLGAITKYSVIIILLLLGYFKLQSYIGSYEDTIRKNVIENAELKKVYEGRYNKLVNDYSTSTNLYTELKEVNATLAKELKDEKLKVVSLSRIKLKVKDTIKRVIIKEPSKVGDTLTFAYPDSISPFIIHKLIYETDTSLVSTWLSKPITLDLVLTETESGIFQTDLSTHEFISVQSLKVKSLPLAPLTDKEKDWFGWSYGAGVYVSKSDLGLDLYGGVKLGRFNTLLRVQPRTTESQLGLSLIYTSK